jgi:hypothetical protein
MAKEGIKPGDKDFKDRLRKDLYFNALQAKYGFAITCHKSQGGEWSNVFVDFNVFIGNRTKAYFRWVYTAITRASLSLDSTRTSLIPRFSSSEDLKIQLFP